MPLKLIALAPVLIVQALWVTARAARLPEAAGPRRGTLGQGPHKRLLLLGDSSAAGVGVSDQSDALGGQLAQALAQRFTVTWTVNATSGATVASTLALIKKMPRDPQDMVLVALGVNDTKNGVRERVWANGYKELLDAMSDRFGSPHICVSGVPPLRHFPLLPRPLSDVLGTRAERFDAILKEIASERANTCHLPMEFPLDADNMSPDGFHPSAKLYREWARRAAVIFCDPEQSKGNASRA